MPEPRSGSPRRHVTDPGKRAFGKAGIFFELKGAYAMDLGIKKNSHKRRWAWAGLAALAWLSGCGVAPDYVLNVIMGEGVTGTPEAGRHVYKEFTTVAFDYKSQNAQETVEVILNKQIRSEGSGSLIMYGDSYELNVRVIDVRGVWKLTLSYADGSVAALDPFRITIMGADSLSGSFTDERGYNGTWTAASNVLRLVYYNWGFYVLGGTVYGMGNQPGSFTGEGLAGSWTAERVS